MLLPTAAEGQSPPVLRTPSTVWVVDDDEFVRDSLTAMLQAFGFSVSAFPSGADLLAHYRDGAASCLVIDQHMPGLAGLEVLAALRGLHAAPPTILITGRVDAEIEQRARLLGAIAVLEKPFSAARLVSLVERAVAAD